jgi:ATP-dependent Clp protease adapter protein ClpS
MRLYEITESPIDTDDDTVIDRPTVRQRQEVPLYVPGGFTVVILNDNVTPFEVVVEAVVAGTRLSPGEAARRVHQAHGQGWAPVASYSNRDIAETVASNIENHAAANTNYDHYKAMQRPPHRGPWPLTCDVMDAEQA